MFINTIFNKICLTAKSQPDRPALFEDERVFTYLEFKNLIEQSCAQLQRMALPPGKRVGIFLGNSINGYVAIYSCALMDLTYIPLPVDDPPLRLKQMIEDAELSLVICDNQTEGSLRKVLDENLQLPVLNLGQDLGTNADMRSPDLLSGTNGHHPLYMLFTSGSTGMPKGVLIPSEGVENFVEWARTYLEIGANDVFLAHSRLTFDLSVFNLYVPFCEGAAVRIVKNPVDQMYPGNLLKKGVTIALTVPRVTGLMLQAGQLTSNAYPALRHLLFCGEKLLAAQANAWIETHPDLNIHNIYGPTETTVTCTVHSLPAGRRVGDPIAIGRAIQNMQLNFLDSELMPVTGVAEGDLVISGVGVSRHDYHRRQTDKFFDHPELGRCFRTGDLVRREADGNLFWLTRLDDQIKIRGFRVELSEIESVLSQHSSVLDLVCVFNPETQLLTAYFTVANSVSSDRTAAELKSLSLEKLPSYMRPAHFFAVESLPRNSNGKVDRKQVAAHGS
jgi:amino acid adenylation domain-containing protein